MSPVVNIDGGHDGGARGAYTGTIGFLVLVLIGILAMFAWAFRHIHVSR